MFYRREKDSPPPNANKGDNNDAANNNSMNEAGPSPGESSESSRGFLSWDRSRRSNEFAHAVNSNDIPILPNQQQSQLQSQSQHQPFVPSTQQQQQYPYQTYSNPIAKNTHSYHNRSASQDKSDHSAISSHSPTPFRPMQPREFSLGSNLGRLHPTMPLPTLPADVSGTATSTAAAGSSRSMNKYQQIAPKEIAPKSNSSSSEGSAELDTSTHSTNSSEDNDAIPNPSRHKKGGSRSSIYSKATSGGLSSMGRIDEEESSGISSGFSASLRKNDYAIEDGVYGDVVPRKPELKQRIRKASGDNNEDGSLSPGQLDGDNTNNASSNDARPQALRSSLASSLGSHDSRISAEYIIQDVAKSSQSLLVYEEDAKGKEKDTAAAKGGECSSQGSYVTGTVEKLNVPSPWKDGGSPESSSAHKPYSYKTPIATPEHRLQASTLAKLPEKRALEVDTSDIDAKRTATVPESIAKSNTPMSVSTISPHERTLMNPRFHRSSNNPTTTTATSRFGRLLQECRLLTETCGESVSSNSDTSSHPTSSHPTTSSKFDESSGSDRKVLQSKLQIKAAAATAHAPSDCFSAGPVAPQQEIDTTKDADFVMSTLTMDPAIMSSLRSSGFRSNLDFGNRSSRGSINFRSSDLGSSGVMPSVGQADFRPSILEEDESKEVSNEPPSKGSSNEPSNDDKVLRLSQRQMRMSQPISKSAVSELSLGVDLMYGDLDETMEDILGLNDGSIRSKRSTMDDETASFNPDKFLMNMLGKAAPSEGAVSEMSSSDRVGAAMAAVKKPAQIPMQEEKAPPPIKDEPTNGREFRPAEETTIRTFQPQEETAHRHSWLSYSSKGTPPQKEKAQSPPKTSPLESDELRIPQHKDIASSNHSTDFTDDSGGLLVGFGQRRGVSVPSEASSISSSDSSESSSGSDESRSEGSGSFRSSGSSGSSSSGSSSGESYTSSEESLSMPPCARDGLLYQDDQSDLVSALSFGGASALMGVQAMKSPLTRSQGRMEVEGTAASPASSKSPPDVGNQKAAGTEEPQLSINFSRPRLDTKMSRRLSRSELPLEKLDEVSESNASFLDDVSSIDEPPPAVRKFFADPAPSDIPSDIWNSFTSTLEPPMPQDADKVSSEADGSRRLSSSSSRNSSLISGKSIEEDIIHNALQAQLAIEATQRGEGRAYSAQPPTGKDERSKSSSIDVKQMIQEPQRFEERAYSAHPPAYQDDRSKSASIDAKQMIQEPDSRRSSHSSSTSQSKLKSPNSSVSLPHNSHASLNASLSSGSYYNGIMARAAALKPNLVDEPLPSVSSASRSSMSSSRHSQLQQDFASGSGMQDAGIKTIESVRSMSSASAPRVQEERVNSATSTHSASRPAGAGQQLDGGNEDYMNDDGQRQSTHQGSGESPLENINPNLDDISSMSSVVSRARDSFSRGLTPFAAQAKARGFDVMSASSKVSGLSEDSREEMAGIMTEPVYKSEFDDFLAINELISNDIAGKESGLKSSSSRAESAISAKDIVANQTLQKEHSVGKESDLKSSSSRAESAISAKDIVANQTLQEAHSVGKGSELKSSSSRAESAIGAKDIGANQTPQKEHRDFDKASMISGDDVNFDGDNLYEDFPSQTSDDDMILRKRSSTSQVLPTSLETDSRKPWRTAPRETLVDVASSRDSQEGNIQVSSGKNEPEYIELQQQGDDISSDGSLELFEAKQSLERMGLYSSAVSVNAEEEEPANDNKNLTPTMEETQLAHMHMSRLSNDSSSITEWDFSNQAKLSGPLINENIGSPKDEGSQVNSFKPGSSHYSMDVEEHELLEASQADTDASNTKIEDNDEPENDDEKANRSSARMLAATADEMTDLLRSSFQSRTQQMATLDFYSDESSSQGDSEKSSNSIIASLKSFQKSFATGERTGSSSASEKGDESSEGSTLQKGEKERKSSVENQEYLDEPIDLNNASLEAIPSKSSDSKESEDDIHTELPSLRKWSVSDGDPSSDVGYGEELRVQRHNSADPSRAFLREYSEKHFDVSEGIPENTSSKAPNPFLDDSSDEETGLPRDTVPLSIENANNEGNIGEEDLGDRHKSRGRRWWNVKTKLCCIALFVVIVAVIIAGILVYQSKEKSPSEPSQDPAEKTPSETQTSSPTRLPTSLPTVDTVPNWVQVGGELVGESPGDEAGFSVSVSEDGSRVIIGVRRNAKDGLKNRGAARIFRFDSLTGSYVPMYDIFGEAAGDQCGFSVSMSKNGKRVAVGSLGSDKGGQNSGQVRIFDENELSPGSWNLVTELIGEEETSLFGASVSLSQDGSNLAVGAPYYSEGADMTRSGRSYVFRAAQESEWEQVGGPMHGTSTNDLFGWSVSFTSNAQFVAVGAPRLEGSLDSGYVKVFSFQNNAWDIYGELMSMGIPGDRFGFSVSLAGDDTLQRVAIGAPGMSENGEGSGMASVYEYYGNGWRHYGDDLVGDGWGENLGYSVSMTPDATRLVVGVPNKKLEGVPVGQIQMVDVKSGYIISAGDIYGRDGEKFGVSVSISYEGELVFGGASDANLVRAYREMNQR